MAEYNLPDIPTNPIQKRSFAGLIDTEAVAASWREIKEAVEALSATVDNMAAAVNRRRYDSMVTIEVLKQMLDNMEQQAGRAKTTGDRIDLDFTADVEHDAGLYTLPAAVGGQFGSGLRLPLAASINYLTSATLGVKYQHGRQIEQNNPQDLATGGIWSVTVKTEQPVVLVPRQELCYLDSGTPCLLEVIMKRPRTVNTIILEPAAAFPMEVIAIRLYSPDGECITIAAPNGGLAGRSSQFLGRTLFRFPDCPVARAELLLNQRHYRRVEDGRLKKTWYEYVYGLTGLFIGRMEYLPAGEWISRTINLPSRTAGVQLEVEESTGEVAAPYTSVEYDVSAGGPWVPLLPRGTRRVERELLRPTLFGRRWHAPLRFRAEDDLEVHSAGRLLTPGSDYILQDNRDVLFDNLPEAPVTASYTAGEGTDYIDLTENPEPDIRMRITMRRHYSAADWATPEIQKLTIRTIPEG